MEIKDMTDLAGKSTFEVKDHNGKSLFSVQSTTIPTDYEGAIVTTPFNFSPLKAKDIYYKLPEIVKTVLLISEGWLVGGAIDDIMIGVNPRDYDIVVPSREKFQLAAAYLDSDRDLGTTINTQGGLKFNKPGLEIDIWCEELDHFLRNCTHFAYAYNMKSQILIKNESR